MKITGLRTELLKGTLEYEGPLAEERLVRPLDIYPEARAEGSRWLVHGQTQSPYKVDMICLHVDTDEGISGLWGPISRGVAYQIESLKGVVIGEDPHAVERIWDKMYLQSIHGRKGSTMLAISAVDLALWDLKGKLLGAPVYQLLGGPTRPKVRAYASMLGYSIEPEKAAQRASEVASQGYTATKWFFRCDPTQGEEGKRRNLELIRTVREAVGPDVEIMFDAWSSWNVPYTLQMAELAAPYRVWWFEEPVLADMIPAYAEIRQGVKGIPGAPGISGGEHEYTRWGIQALLAAGAVDVLQPDVTWAGGLTEMYKICALASAYDIPVIPHHGGMASLNLIASQPTKVCPIQEWLVQEGIVTQHFFTHKIVPRDGYIELPTGPGIGIELDETAIEAREELVF